MENKPRADLPQRFKPGNKLAPGGPRPGSGRPPDWLKLKCQEIVEKDDIVGFLRQIARGDLANVSVSNGPEGTTETRAVRVQDQLKAAEMLKDWGFGREDVAETGKVMVSLVQLIVQARAERELPVPAELMTNGHSK